MSDDKIIADIESTPYGYEFKSGALTVSFANNPNLSSLKNDFSIWGTRKTAAGGEIPIHLRYAIDEKPTYYKTYEGKIYSNKETIDKLLQEIDEAYETIKRDTIYQIETYQKAEVPASLGND